jgi:hypothetical protein
MMPGHSGGIIASKKRDLPEGTEGQIMIKIITNCGIAHACLYFDTPFRHMNQAGIKVNWESAEQSKRGMDMFI